MFKTFVYCQRQKFASLASQLFIASFSVFLLLSLVRYLNPVISLKPKQAKVKIKLLV